MEYSMLAPGGYTFYELAEAVFHALHMETAVEYIDMPMQLRGSTNIIRRRIYRS